MTVVAYFIISIVAKTNLTKRTIKKLKYWHHEK